LRTLSEKVRESTTGFTQISLAYDVVWSREVLSSLQILPMSVAYITVHGYGMEGPQNLIFTDRRTDGLASTSRANNIEIFLYN